jgi:hypothetical protein
MNSTVQVLLRYLEAIQQLKKFLNIWFIAVIIQVALDPILRQWAVI